MLLVTLGIIGMLTSLYIYYSKKYHESIVCPVGGKCNVVIGSKYGKSLGINNEVGGIFFYLMIIFAGFFEIRNLFITLSSVASVLFSFYLGYTQIFKIKAVCTWCYTSYIINILIFLVVVGVL